MYKMIDQALILFRDKLSEHNENYTNNDLDYLVELGGHQLKSSYGFGFCQMHSTETFLGSQLKNIHLRKGVVKREYIARKNPGSLDWKQKLDFLVHSELNNQSDVVMIGYVKRITSRSYSLHPVLLRLLISCFFDNQNNLLLTNVAVSAKRHKTSYSIPKRDAPEKSTSKSVPPLHNNVLDKLNYGLMNKGFFNAFIRSKYLSSGEDIKDLVYSLAAISTLDKILKQGLTEIDNQGIYSYPLAYNISGANHPRLVDQLPVQNLPKELKAALYDQVECVNYDIKSSNMNMLEKLFRDAALDSTWFIGYLQEPDERRQRLIDEIGCTLEQVKKAIQAVTNGAPFNANPWTVVGTIFGTIDKGKVFVEELSDLQRCMREFKNLVDDDDKNKVFKSRSVWQNAVGMTCRFDEDATFGQKCSFLVMGLEQKFILTLISKLPDNIKVYTLMHDGFVCSGKIPEELIKEVKTECDLPYLIFEQQEGF
mgnify:CR=1 FL=1